MIKENKKNIYIALFIVAAFYLVFFFSVPKAYDGNDDVSIQLALSGMITGTPFPVHPYIHVFLSAPISFLYRVLPHIPWWYLWSTFIFLVGLSLVHVCLLRQVGEKMGSLVYAVGVLALFDYGISFYCISRMNFSIVPAFLGTGCIALVLSMDKMGQSNVKRIGVFSFIGFVIAFCHRWESGVAISGYFALSWFYYYCRTEHGIRPVIIRTVRSTACICLIGVLLVSTNTWIQDQVNGPAYQEFNKARSRYLDYPHSDYSENIELFEEYGWDEETAALVNYWCFMDEHITSESLEGLSGENQFSGAFIHEELKQLLQNRDTRLLMSAWIASCILWLCSSTFKYDKYKLWSGILNLLGTLILFCYLLVKGRIIYRALAPFVIPSFVMFVFFCFADEHDYSDRDRTIFGLLTAAMVFMILPSASRLNFDEAWADAVVAKKEKEAIINKYASDHPDDVYITDLEYQLLQINPIINPIESRSVSKTVNLVSWGNALTHSALEKEQLSMLDFSAGVRGSMLKKENVHLLSSLDLQTKEHINPLGRMGAFYQWMTKNYGAIGICETHVICDGFAEYDFVFQDTADRHEIYYVFNEAWEPVLISTD